MSTYPPFLAACNGEATDHVPVWFMRQAGRYLPEYRRVRADLDFLALCKNPELAAEVTLQPVRRLGVDAAILFSDILIPMEAMGLELRFDEGRGPVFPNPVRDREAVRALRAPAFLEPIEFVREHAPFVMKTIDLLLPERKVPLIGFAGAPFTLATYVIEGGGSRNFLHTKRMMYQAPDLFHELLEKISACSAAFLITQARCGAEAVQLFDTWAGALCPEDYARFALPYAQRVLEEVRGYVNLDFPLIYFANNGATLLPQTRELPAEVLSLDWRLSLDEALAATRHVPHLKAVQGNLDPLALFLPKKELAARVTAMLDTAHACRGKLGYVFNLGHGIIPETDPDQVKLVVDTVHAWSARN